MGQWMRASSSMSLDTSSTDMCFCSASSRPCASCVPRGQGSMCVHACTWRQEMGRGDTKQIPPPHPHPHGSPHLHLTPPSPTAHPTPPSRFTSPPPHHTLTAQLSPPLAHPSPHPHPHPSHIPTPPPLLLQLSPSCLVGGPGTVPGGPRQ